MSKYDFKKGDNVICVESNERGSLGSGWRIGFEFEITDISKGSNSVYWGGYLGHGVYGRGLKLVEPKTLINKETMTDITEFSKKSLNDAKKEVALERAEKEKETAKEVLREIYNRKDKAESVIKTTNKDLEKIDESLEEFNKK